jgi:hypothetical protein
MSIRSWWENRRRRADAEAIKRVEEEAVETPGERAHSQGDRLGEAADERVARRAGEAGIDDVNRLGDFPR